MLTETTIAALAPGRGAIITGGANGIGLATARQLAVFGMRVCIADRDDDALKAAVGELASVAPNGAADVLGVKLMFRRSARSTGWPSRLSVDSATSHY